MFKFFSKKKESKTLSENMDILLEDVDAVRIAFDELHKSVNESNRLIGIIQDQCNEIISIMEKKDEEDKNV
jgi:Mg/Co/Ni transporter MgtE